MWHTFNDDISQLSLPRQFTFPFHYTPHPLCVKAAREVKDYLTQRIDWQEELQLGKMFGVLVCQSPEGEIGFLAAFSGILAGSNLHPYFVPPVYDLQQPDGFFKKEEAEITALNRRIADKEQDATYRDWLHQLQLARALAEEEKAAMKTAMRAAKERRDNLRRSQGDDKALMDKLVKESQFQKAELKRMEQQNQQRILTIQRQIDTVEAEIHTLKAERKTRSAALQEKLFRHFRILNGRGEETDIATLFAHVSQTVPPAGAGECAAPKLLQFAYLNHLRPLCMAEFWWGKATTTELRRHGAYYPACQSKCGPILTYMLQGIDVEPNPLHTRATEELVPEIIYEDEDILLINKPSGLLSVPGKDDSDSVYSYIKGIRPQAEGPLIVHRLDQATSGLMLIAKKKEIHENLQKQFLHHTIKKRYKAILEKVISTDKGEIHLPLAPNPSDRPRQIVDTQHGKAATTHYQVERIEDGRTRIVFYPQTGRTHQLRVHAAHPDGLHAPIQGDKLYGASRTEDRLYLHADQIQFIHPRTHEKIWVEIATPF